MKYLFSLLILTLSLSKTYAQNELPANRRLGTPDTTIAPGASVSEARLIKGIIQSAADGTTLPGATVLLQKAADSKTITGAVTDADGNFRFERVPGGHYNIKVDYIGFKPFALPIHVQQQTMDLGILKLHEATTTMKEVVIVGKIPPGEQKGDTSQFNAAAFKTAPDASAQDLVQKMPGITIEDGQLQAQGETVQQILIDGKPFFGNDVDAALQNLPAEIIANIQVFDKRSDKAELSGFDDGERIRTINIVTKPEARRGQFGRVTGGYGTDNTYMVGASVNFFKNDRRLTLTGLSNNINLLSFSADPENSGQNSARNGIVKSNVFGLNYTNTWLEKIDLAGSYSFNNRDNNYRQLLQRDFIQSAWAGQEYSETNQSNSITGDHRVNLRLDYEMNERNRIRIRTRGNRYDNRSNSLLLGRSIYDEGPLNSTENFSEGENESYNFNNVIVYSHRLLKEGRSINFRLNNRYNSNNGESFRTAENISFVDGEETELLLQRFESIGKGYSWETQVSYTEPVGRYGQLELEYEIGNRVNDSDRRAFDRENPEEAFRQLNYLSNTFTNEYLTQETELGYRYNNERLFFQVETEYQHAQLMNEQQYPRPYEMTRTFTSILPSARMRYKFTESNNLEFNYDTRTNVPSVGQLQEVIDNSNPLQIRMGNPELEQAFQNQFRVRYRAHNPETNHNFYASVSSSFENNVIVNSITEADQSPYLDEDVVIQRGAQLIRPVNLDGYRDIRTYFSYGQPIGFIQSNLNLNGSISFNRRPGMISEQLNFVNSSRLRAGASLSSNISERIDFNLSTRSSYNIVKNSLRPSQNNNFFSQRTRLQYNWIFGDGFVYRTNINHQLNTGLSEGYNANLFLWNMSFGKKLFARELGEVSVSVYDLLKQNVHIRRNINETFIDDVESNVLGRYFMLTFTYNIRNFGGGSSIDDFRETERN